MVKEEGKNQRKWVWDKERLKNFRSQKLQITQKGKAIESGISQVALTVVWVSLQWWWGQCRHQEAPQQGGEDFGLPALLRFQPVCIV